MRGNATNKSGFDRFVDDLWVFFSSVKVTVVLLILIAVFATFGTFIQQNSDPSVYVKFYGEAGYRLIKFFQLDNLYSAWYFQLLLAILVINLIVCTLERFPGVWRSLKKFSLYSSPQSILRQQFSAEGFINFKDSPASSVEKTLASRGYKTTRFSEGDRVVIGAEKGRLSRYGPYITHLGLIIIVIGAMLGGVKGVRGYVEIPEGDAVNYFFEQGTHRKIALPFNVKCERFWIDYYPGRGMMPKDYFSKLAVYDEGELVMRKTIQVNDPLTYKGYTFYQANYRPRSYSVDLLLQVKYANGTTQEVKASYGEEFNIAKGWIGKIVDFSSDFQNLGPVAIIEAKKEGAGSDSVSRFPVFAHFSQFSHGSLPGISRIAIKNFHIQVASYFTGLQVKKDPGVPVVIIGFVVVSFGVIISLSVFHRKVWIYIAKEGEKWHACIGGWTYKNKSGFEREFKEIVKRLSIQKMPDA